MSEKVTIKEAISQFKEYKQKLKDGLAPGIKTRYEILNKALRDGIPKNTITTIAAHSGKGKTALALNLMMDAPLLNPGAVVYFLSLEMPATALVARRLSNKSKQTVSKIYEKDYDVDFSLLNDIENLDFTIDTRTGTIENIYNRIDAFCANYPEDRDIIVCIDHSLLTEGKDDYTKNNDLPTAMNRLKLKYKNINIIIISQLNDAFLAQDRRKEHGVALFPSLNDLYYGRQIYFISDTVIVLNVPSDYIDEVVSTENKYYRKEYGNLPMYTYNTPTKIPLLYMHIIKGRDTGPSILSFGNMLKYNELLEGSIINK